MLGEQQRSEEPGVDRGPGRVDVVLADRLVGAADIRGGRDDVVHLAGGGEEPFDVPLDSDVHGNGVYAELPAYRVELLGGAAGDRDLAALGNELGGESEAHTGAAADDHYVFLH